MTDHELLELLVQKVTGIDNRMENIESQLGETNEIAKALMHRTEELDAKFDGLLNTTANKETVTRLDAKLDRLESKIDRILATQATQGESINILALRQLKTEAEVEALKKAK